MSLLMYMIMQGQHAGPVHVVHCVASVCHQLIACPKQRLPTVGLPASLTEQGKVYCSSADTV